MIRVTFADLLKAIKKLESESMQGFLNVKEEGCWLQFHTTDRAGREMVIKICDEGQKYKPQITKTEVF